MAALALPWTGAGGAPLPTNAASEPSSKEGQFARQILWTETRDGQQTARFIPEQALRETPLEELPVTEGGRNVLWHELEGYEESRRKLIEIKGFEPPECSRPPERQVVPHEPVTLAREIVEYSRFGFIADVVEVVTGWDTRSRRVIEVVYVRETSILHDPENRLLEGDVLKFIQNTGELRIGDRTLCTKPSSNFYLAQEHDRLLIAGDTYSDDPHLLYATLRLQVQEEVIQPFPMPTLLAMEALPIGELEKQVATLRRLQGQGTPARRLPGPLELQDGGRLDLAPKQRASGPLGGSGHRASATPRRAQRIRRPSKKLRKACSLSAVPAHVPPDRVRREPNARRPAGEDGARREAEAWPSYWPGPLPRGERPAIQREGSGLALARMVPRRSLLQGRSLKSILREIRSGRGQEPVRGD